MKINKSGISQVLLSKNNTVVGEIYTTKSNAYIYMRCQGGFVDMESGAFTDFSATTENPQWVHLPNATLVVNG